MPARPIPEKEVPEEETKDSDGNSSSDGNSGSDGTDTPNKGEAETNVDLSKIEVENSIITKGKPGKIFVMACSSMLQDNMLDPEGRTTNATFILNVIDHLNDQDDIAVMRSKIQTLNPLAETTPFARGFIKTFNIAGLPILMVLFGFGVWARRSSRKKTIKIMFQK